MQEVNLISGIAQIALYAALIALVIYLIIALKRITGAVGNINGAIDNIEKQVAEITQKTMPLVENSLLITNDIREISGIIKGQVEKVDTIVDSLKDTTDSIIEFEQKVQKEVETNVFDTLNMIAAISKGVRTFWSALSGMHNGSPRLSRADKIRSLSSEEEEDLY
jgi:uncharacterized protein YoxC